jgi:hypothetical protein
VIRGDLCRLLADGLNLGLTRMAEACTVASLGQLAWTADWQIRDETYALALFGTGTAFVLRRGNSSAPAAMAATRPAAH